ncbi:hypothetical protein DPMN_100849 [Dreissena polymorpha]|uniref:Uncharacterized protein n=1 Tax=Dreissena polymorpha TaxID=45954 RepID=A0A9D4LI17_DREPO|nr:hypothetical protein DPMN_100849 [Dreissena polymorpha]
MCSIYLVSAFLHKAHNCRNPYLRKFLIFNIDSFKRCLQILKKKVQSPSTTSLADVDVSPNVAVTSQLSVDVRPAIVSVCVTPSCPTLYLSDSGRGLWSSVQTTLASSSLTLQVKVASVFSTAYESSS